MPLKGTLIGNYNAPVTLTGATYANPVTVAGTAIIDTTIGNALLGQGPTAWTIINQGLIETSAASGNGVQLAAGGTVTNAGTIVASAGDAVHFSPGFADLLAFDPGAVFSGTVDGGNTVGATASSTLELASGAAAGTIGGIGTQYIDFTDITIDAGANWTVANANSIAAGVTLTIDGTLTDTGSLGNAGSIAGDVYVAPGAGFSNAAGGAVSDTINAILFQGLGSLDNAGSISSGGFGVNFIGGGTLVNETSGVVAATGFNAGAAVQFRLAGSVDNAGTITGAGVGYAVNLGGLGTVTNEAGATIAGYGKAIGIFGTAAASPGALVTNAGTIGATNGPGIVIASGGTVSNTGVGLIESGGTAVYFVFHPGALYNTATLSGQSGVVMAAGGSVVNAAGGVISASYRGISIAGGGTVTNAGTIAATGANAIAVALAGGSANRLVVDAGAVFTGAMDGGNAVGATAVSVLELAAGSGTLAGFTNFGSIAFDADGTWDISGSTAALAGGEMITGFGLGDTIELTGVTGASVAGFAAGTLALSDGLSLLLPGSTYTAAQFIAATNGGNTDITIACFVAGTRILTDAGEVAVEELRPGMRVVSLTHRRPVPVRWVGWRTVGAASPVRIAAGAFGEGLPHRSLHLSPDHAVFLDGVLIPVRTLINGTSIAPVACAMVRYFHAELEAHAVLLAEGLPAESYLDTGNRSAFATDGNQKERSLWHSRER